MQLIIIKVKIDNIWYPISYTMGQRSGLSWSWSYGSWIYNCLCNQTLSPLKLWVRTLFVAKCIWYNIMW